VSVDDRALELLEIAGIFGGERLRGQPVKEASKNLGASPAKTYRLVEEKLLGCIKEEARGSSVRIRWIDIARFQAENEHVTGQGPRALFTANRGASAGADETAAAVRRASTGSGGAT